MTTKTKKRVVGRVLIAAALAVSLVVGLIPDSVRAAETKISDLTTETKYTESLGHDASTEYAGRIWTDKSVYSDDAVIELMTGSNTTIENDSDFLVAFSALATSQSISGVTQAPVDVVFIIDTSGSMTDDMSSTDSTNRIVNTVAALNSAIESIMSLNDYTRVSVVAFANTSEVLLPLGRYEKGTYSYTTGGGRDQQTVTVTDYFSLRGNTLNVHAKAEGTNTTVSDSRSVTGGTNIQRGIYEGMNVLVSQTSTTANINGSVVQRVPSVVLLSDGAPTYSSSSSSWWAPANNNNDGPGGSPYYGNGMKALMTGAYMKAAIDRNYGVTGTAAATTMYTIGMGITGLNNYERWGNSSYYTGEQDLAYMTLNPKANWSETNSMATSITGAWTTYTTNDGTPTVDTDDDETYTFTHPTSYDIDTNTDALKNLVDDYYDADSATAVTQVFNQIVSNISISAPEVPTELKHTDAMTTGYITYTDPIGEYLEVKDVKGIIYKGVVYDSVTANSDGTYTVSAEVESDLYGTQNLSGVKISVTESAGMQTLKVEIPAALIPVRINTVTLNEDGSVKSHTNNGSYPMRVLYTVGLEDGLTAGEGQDKYVLTEKLSDEYIAANTADGEISFYSNLYTGENVVNGHTAGNATVEFEPAHTNPFYYIQGEMPIYKDEACTWQVKASEGLADGTTYYYKDVYYEGTSEVSRAIARTGVQLKKTEIVTGEDGNLYRAAGTPRLNRILEFEGTKTNNSTNTAEAFYAPTFEHADGDPDPAAGKYVIYLGNNGVLSLPGSGALEISKDVVVEEGLTPSTTEFEFTVDFNGNETLAGEFAYEIVGTATTGTIADGGKLTLKDGETARITDLPVGTTYTVTEADYSGVGFTTTKSGDTGTIAAGVTGRAEFVNTYEVEEIEFPPTGDTGFAGKKILEGRAWMDGTDAYSFLITPYNNAPLPAGYNAATGTTVTTAAAIDANTYEAAFDFGKITFTEPGVYRYTISEFEPATEDFLPGISYSRALYRVVVTVVDNGDGTLKAEADIQKLYTDDATALFTYGTNNEIVMNAGQEGQDEIVFTNTYEAEAVTRVPVATKTYIDESGATRLVSGMFEFKLEAIGYCYGDYDAATLVADTTIPMPAGSVNGVVTTTNEGTAVTFPSATFTNADMKGQTKITYRYKMTEVAGTTAAMNYDASEYYINVVLSVDGQSHVLSAAVQYLDAAGADVRIAHFTNTLNPEEVTITKDAQTAIHGTKTLTGRTFTSADTFRFTLTAVNDAAKTILPTAETVTLDAAAAAGKNAEQFWFGDMTFDKVGTYEFTVTEEAGSAGGVTYDTDTTKVTVTVTLNEAEGELEAAVVYANAQAGASTTEAEFENIYETEFTGTPVTLAGSKTLTGKSLVAGEYYFRVTEVDVAGETLDSYLVAHEADADEDGTAAIVFLEDIVYDAAGTYTYLIREQIPTPAVGGTRYDTTEYRYTVVVTDDGAGNLSVTSTTLEKRADASADWAAAAEIAFVNIYEPTPLEITIPPIQKVISGDRGTALQAGEFEFQLTLVSADPADGVVLPGTTRVANDASGNVVFDKVTFKKAGYYTFKISEVIPAGVDEDPAKEGVQVDGITYSTQEITATVHVVDDRNGNLSVAIAENTGGKTITNTYESTGSGRLTIEKILTGRGWEDSDKFEFEIVIEDPVTLAAVNAGDIVFPNDGDNIVKLSVDKDNQTVVSPEITFNKPGTYKFLVHEVNGVIPGILYDESRHEVIVTAVDNSDGTITVSTNYTDNKLTYTNVYDDESTEISGHTHLAVNKVFTGRAEDTWLDTDKFAFTLEAADTYTQDAVDAGEIELPDNAAGLIVSNANKNHAHFGNIIFHEANGTGEYYKFVVKELNTSTELTALGLTKLSGVEYDSDADRIIAVEVKSNGTGQLVAAVVDAQSESLTFTNTYSADEVTLNAHTNLVVTKELVGRDWFGSDSFEFTLEAKDDATKQAIADGDVILPDSVKSTTITKDDANYQDAFADDSNPDDGITFKKTGVYSFLVKEVEGSIDNMAYDGHTTEIVVTVEDGGQGNLVVAAATYIGSMTFTNTYTPDAVTAALEGSKTLSGRTLADSEFTFEIQAVGNAPMPANAVVSNVGSQVSFGAISYAAAGTYKYNITEQAGGLAGITYDAGTVEATVTVSYDAATGTLSTDVAYVKVGGNGGTGFEFVNTYTTEKTDPVAITATKSVVPTTGNTFTMADGDFQFEIEPSASNPQPDPITKQVVGNVAAGDITFADKAEFTQEGTYVYTVHEVDGNRAGINYDTSVYTITVVVTDNEVTAKLEAEVTVEKNGEPVASGLNGIVFENGYDPSETTALIYGQKNLLGDHKDLEAGEFTFKIEAADGTPMPAADTVTNEVTGLFQFGVITYETPGTYEYTVSEVVEGKTGYGYDETPYTVTVEVTDENGELKAVVTGVKDSQDQPIIVLNNTYVPTAATTSISGKKSLVDPEGNASVRPLGANEFTFQLLNEKGGEVAAAKNAADGTFTFENVSFEKAGTYNYTIVEKTSSIAGITDDISVFAVEIKVVDNGGVLEATVTYPAEGVEFKNVYKAQKTSIQLSAIKRLEGRTIKADEFTFELLNDKDEVIGTVKNNADGVVLFETIEYTEAGTYKYKIREVKGIEPYMTYDETVHEVEVTVEDGKNGFLTAKLNNNGEAIVFENVYKAPQPETPETPPVNPPVIQSPKTGDSANIALWAVLLAVSVAGAISAVVVGKRKKVQK